MVQQDGGAEACHQRPCHMPLREHEPRPAADVTSARDADGVRSCGTRWCRSSARLPKPQADLAVVIGHERAYKRATSSESRPKPAFVVKAAADDRQEEQS